jgi:hypothetical protein
MCFPRSRTSRILFSAALVGSLAGCGGLGSVEQPAIVTNEITAIEPVECGSEPKADRMHMRKVEPWVVTDTAGLTWIGISPQHYENLSQNIGDTLAHLKQRKAQVEWWRDCVEAHNERAERFGTEGGDNAEQTRGGESDDTPAESERPSSDEVVDEG